MPAKMNPEQITQFLDHEFPQIHTAGRVFFIESVEDGEICMRFTPDDSHLRPGGTVSGPSMFTLADLAAYVLILSHYGPVALAVTTNLNINFLRKPEPGHMRAVCRRLKAGKRLCVVNVDILGGEEQSLVAHATSTYSIPAQ